MTARVRELYLEKRAAEAKLEEGLKADYPVNKSIKWKRGDRVYSGRVALYGTSGDRIHVRNSTTQKAYWIHVYDLLEAMEGGAYGGL